jgi:hypothetical protein
MPILCDSPSRVSLWLGDNIIKARFRHSIKRVVQMRCAPVPRTLKREGSRHHAAPAPYSTGESFTIQNRATY